MDSSERKIIFIGLSILAFFASGLIYLLQIKTVKTDTTLLGDYEMIRPNDPGSLYTLAGREVQKNILENDPASPQATQVIKPFNPVLANQQNVANKANAKIPDAYKPQFRTQVVDTDIKNTLTDQTADNETSSQSDQVAAYYGSPDPIASAANGPEEKSDKDKKKTSFQELKNQLLLTYNSKEVDKLVEALGEGEVQDSEYYGLAFELLKNSKKESHTAGLLMLEKANSPQYLEYLIKGYAQISDSDLRQTVWTLILSYSESSKSFQLLTGLNSKDKSVQRIAVQILTYKVKTLKSQVAQNPQTTNPRQDIKSLQTFLPTLSEILKSSDTSVSVLVQQISFDIQNLSRFDRVATDGQ